MENLYTKLLSKALTGRGVATIRDWINKWFVRKETGKGLSEENYTATDKQRVSEAITQDDLDEAIFENDKYILSDDEINHILGVAESAEDFLNALTENDVVTLGADIELDTPVVIEKDLTIELDGFTLTGAAASKTANLFTVNSSTLTLKGPGLLTVSGRIAQANDGAEIVVESGSYETNDVAFAAGRGGKVTMNGGAIQAVEGGIAKGDVVTKIASPTANNLVKQDSNGKIADAGVAVGDVQQKLASGAFTSGNFRTSNATGFAQDAGYGLASDTNVDDMIHDVWGDPET